METAKHNGWYSKEQVENLNEVILQIEVFDNKGEFSQDPRSYLQKAGVSDPSCLIGNEEVSFSKIVSSADESARLAVAQTLVRRMQASSIQMEGEDPVPEPRYALVWPNIVAFANAVGWETALAFHFMNVNEECNVNTGCYTNEVFNNPARRAIVSLEDGYKASELCRELDLRGYSIARQGALLKSLIASKEGLPVEGYFNFECNHDGLEFSVGGFVREGTIYIEDAKVMVVA